MTSPAPTATVADDPRSSPTAPTAVTSHDDTDDARRLAAALARWYAETLAGRRDARPLRDLFTPAVMQRVRCAVLREAARRAAGAPGQAAVVTVRSVRVQRHGDRYEVVVTVDDGTRATAVAATLHRRGEGWLVSDLARPEDRLPALPTPWLSPT